MTIYDYLVVGSGCSGAMAAQTLVEAGVNVVMADVGFEADKNEVPNKDYLTIRKTEAEQYKYMIGKKGEGINWGSISKGAQLTPPRSYMTKRIDDLIPLESDSFSPVESLGYGGLGIGWGLQCWKYSAADLKNTGLNIQRMDKAYELVSQRIGISASKDDAARYTIGGLSSFQQSANMDLNHRYITKKYTSRKAQFKRDGMYVGRTPLALITENQYDRKGYEYHDMDFYSNSGLSAWRPYITIDKLRQRTNFTYIGSHLVTSFDEKDDIVTVNTIDTNTNEALTLKCRNLILAVSALGSARITLRSLGNQNSRTSFLSNPHSYIPCIQPALLGKGSEKHKLGLGQLSYFIDAIGDDSGISVASSYGYQELMLFRIINQIPLNFKDARIITSYLASGLVIMIVQHPDSLSRSKYVKLVASKNSPSGDKLVAHYSISDQEEIEWDKRERQYLKLMRRLNTYPLKRVHPPHGSSIHYAGTLPFSNTQKEFGLSPEGRLHGARHVYVADSSGFNYLPAKGLTFTLMANAHLTAQNALENKI
jgi:hypothetical protein